MLLYVARDKQRKKNYFKLSFVEACCLNVYGFQFFLLHLIERNCACGEREKKT